jgi:integrase/recombinase XerD
MNKKEKLIYQLKREMHLRRYAETSIETYSSCLNVFLCAMAGKPAPLSIEHIKTFLLQFKNANYHKQMVSAIHRFYEFVLKNPLKLDDIPYPRKTDYLPQIFSVQEVNRLLNSYDNLKHKAIIQLMYSCGLRTGEISKILVSDIDSNREIIRIAGAKGFKDRDVPIPLATIELLRSYYKQYKPKNLLFEGQFVNEAYSERSIQQIFWQGVHRINCKKKVRPHSLRHSRATHLKEAGLDIKDLKDFLGHNQIKTTELYLKLAKESLSKRIIQADEKLAAVLNFSNNKLLA